MIDGVHLKRLAVHTDDRGLLVAHGYRVLGNEPAGLLYHTTEAYDPTDPDEERIPFDDPTIGFDWTTRPR